MLNVTNKRSRALLLYKSNGKISEFQRKGYFTTSESLVKPLPIYFPLTNFIPFPSFQEAIPPPVCNTMQHLQARQ